MHKLDYPVVMSHVRKHSPLVTLSMGKEITPASTCVPDQIGFKGYSATPYPTLPQLSILGILLALLSV